MMQFIKRLAGTSSVPADKQLIRDCATPSSDCSVSVERSAKVLSMLSQLESETLIRDSSSPSTDGSIYCRSESFAAETERLTPERPVKDVGDIEYSLEIAKPDEEIVYQEKYVLHQIHECPEWLQDNEFILTGYRVNFSWRLCWYSMFRNHNETWNVWTHMLGFFMFIGIEIGTFVTLLRPNAPDATWHDRVMMAIFCFSIQFCLFSSSIFHLLFCHSHSALKCLVKLDYGGITVLIFGSFFPAIYYFFYCSAAYQMVYLTGITIFAVPVLITSFWPTFERPEYRSVRAGMFAALGGSGLVPVLHACYMFGFSSDWTFRTLWRLLLMGGMYGLGAVFYAMRIPERWKPGFFDIYLNSHQIFHLLVVGAAYLHWTTLCLAFQEKDELPCYAL